MKNGTANVRYVPGADVDNQRRNLLSITDTIDTGFILC